MLLASRLAEVSNEVVTVTWFVVDCKTINRADVVSDQT